MSDRTAFSEFAAFEREGWTRVADGYTESFGRCTSLAIEPLLDAARVISGIRVLDVACGPGYGAAAALLRGAKAAGLDFSGPMVVRAKALHPGAEFREGDAAELPWPDASFDAVISNFGVQHFPDCDRALAEMLRVLRPGGRLAFTVWDEPERSEVQRLINAAIAAEGEGASATPVAPPAYRFADAGEVRRTLVQVGFTAVETRPLDLLLQARSGSEILENFRRGTVRLGAQLKVQTPERLERIRVAFERALDQWRTRDGVAVPMRAVLSSATKA